MPIFPSNNYIPYADPEIWTPLYRIKLAKDPNTQGRDLDRLIKEIEYSTEEIKEQVSIHPNTFSSTLHLLSSGSVYIRKLVVKHKNISSFTLTQLAQDTDKWIRMYVANNISTPTLVLTQLSQQDLDWEVKYQAKKTLEKLNITKIYCQKCLESIND